jgi:phosphoribosylanthranilate isomerase
MTPPPLPKVKICCIASVEEARLAVEHGASALGLVSAMPSGPGPIPEERIAEIAASTPSHVHTFLLTCLTTPREIAAQVRRVGVNTVQLVDEVEAGGHAALRALLPDIRLVQVLHVRGEQTIAEAERIAPEVDALLLDSGNPSLAVKELGGTGRVHDWRISRRIVQAVDRPVYLAGGLTEANVGEAVRAVRPYGLDLCSGVRTAGALDEEKLAAFFAALAPRERGEE